MMDATEQQVAMAAKLYEMRDAAKRLLGEKFKSRMTEIGKLLSDSALRDGKTVLVSAMALCRERNLQGMDVIVVMAAAVELVEPSVGLDTR